VEFDTESNIFFSGESSITNYYVECSVFETGDRIFTVQHI